MKTNFTFYFIAITLLFTSFSQASNINSKQPNKKENHTLTFEQNDIAKKITLNSYNSDYIVEIFDTEGNITKKLNLKKNSNIEVSTADLKAGKYFLRYVGKNKKNNSVKKIIDKINIIFYLDMKEKASLVIIKDAFYILYK